jgi:formamidopyrimidine-DNA glycosylase
MKSFTLSNLRRIINSIVDKKKDMMIGIFLLEQKYISGIGNYLRSDILYDASISPFRSLTSLSDDNIKILHKSIHKIVKKSYKIQKKNGLHSYPFLVYKQKKTKKMENVSHTMIGTRFIYWVPSKQK